MVPNDDRVTRPIERIRTPSLDHRICGYSEAQRHRHRSSDLPSDGAGRGFVISEKPLKSTPGRTVRQPLRLAGRSTAHAYQMLPDGEMLQPDLGGFLIERPGPRS